VKRYALVRGLAAQQNDETLDGPATELGRSHKTSLLEVSMTRWLKRIRGALGMGLTWAVGWAPVGAVVGWIAALLAGGPLAGVVEAMLLYAGSGFVVGTVFSGLLGIAEGRRRFDEMSLGRFATWGALGGLLISPYTIFDGVSITLTSVVGVGVVTLLSAASAAASLALARRENDEALLEAGLEAVEVQPSSDESRRLLRGV
jgi:hypothetical protein